MFSHGKKCIQYLSFRVVPRPPYGCSFLFLFVWGSNYFSSLRPRGLVWYILDYSYLIAYLKAKTLQRHNPTALAVGRFPRSSPPAVLPLLLGKRLKKAFDLLLCNRAKLRIFPIWVILILIHSSAYGLKQKGMSKSQAGSTTHPPRYFSSKELDPKKRSWKKRQMD